MSEARQFFQSGYPPEDIDIMGLSACAGVFVLSRSADVVFGAHLPSPDIHQAGQLQAMLRDAQAVLAGVTDVEIWVSGCCISSDSMMASTRMAVESAVRTEFPHAKHNIHWPAAGAIAVNMVLDPEHWQVEIIDPDKR